MLNRSLHDYYVPNETPLGLGFLASGTSQDYIRQHYAYWRAFWKVENAQDRLKLS